MAFQDHLYHTLIDKLSTCST